MCGANYYKVEKYNFRQDLGIKIINRGQNFFAMTCLKKDKIITWFKRQKNILSISYAPLSCQIIPRSILLSTSILISVWSRNKYNPILPCIQCEQFNEMLSNVQISANWKDIANAKRWMFVFQIRNNLHHCDDIVILSSYTKSSI